MEKWRDYAATLSMAWFKEAQENENVNLGITLSENIVIINDMFFNLYLCQGFLFLIFGEGSLQSVSEKWIYKVFWQCMRSVPNNSNF